MAEPLGVGRAKGTRSDPLLAELYLQAFVGTHLIENDFYNSYYILNYKIITWSIV